MGPWPREQAAGRRKTSKIVRSRVSSRHGRCRPWPALATLSGDGKVTTQGMHAQIPEQELRSVEQEASARKSAGG